MGTVQLALNTATMIQIWKMQRGLRRVEENVIQGLVLSRSYITPRSQRLGAVITQLAV